MEDKKKKQRELNETEENSEQENETGKLGGETTLEEYGDNFYSNVDSEEKSKTSENI